jgi:two-component system, LytTR family, sensor kinase
MATLFPMAMKIRFNKYVEAAILAFSAFGFAGRFWALPELTLPEHILYFFIQIAILNGLWIAYYVLNHRLNHYLPYERGIINRIATQLILGWLLIECVMIPIALYAYERVMPMREVSLDKIHFLFIGLTAFFGSSMINLGFIADHFFGQWRKNSVRAANLEKEKAQVQFDNLKNQLNPHFLFNSLASLDSLIMDNPELAREFLQQLSKVYRYVLKSQDKGLVRVEMEVEFVKNYISLLSTRFSDSLSVDIELDPLTLDHQVVPLTFQILLENAIKHNTIHVHHPLHITIRSEGDWLTVTNNTNPKENVENSNGTGLMSLSSLYQFLSKRPLEIERGDNQFTVRVPLMLRGVSSLQEAR